MKVLRLSGFLRFALCHFSMTNALYACENSPARVLTNPVLGLGLNNLLVAYEDKSAYALCVFSLALGPNEEPLTFSGKTPVCSLR